MTEEFQATSMRVPSDPIVNVRGERVALGPLHRELLPLIERWDNEFQTVDLGGDEPRPRSAEVIAATWEPMLRGERADWIGFTIYALPDLRRSGSPIFGISATRMARPSSVSPSVMRQTGGRDSVPKRLDSCSTTHSPC